MYRSRMSEGGLAAADRRFGENFRERRLRAGLSQKDVAVRMAAQQGAPYHQQTVQRIETGQQAPRLGEAETLAAIVSAPLDALLRAPGLAREATRLIHAVRDAREAYRLLAESRDHLDKARDALRHALAATEEKGIAADLAPEVSLARLALRETDPQ